MDSRELQYVIVISEKGSFSEAAKYGRSLAQRITPLS